MEPHINNNRFVSVPMNSSSRKHLYIVGKDVVQMVEGSWVCVRQNLFLVQSGLTDGQTVSDAYEPTVQFAQVG